MKFLDSSTDSDAIQHIIDDYPPNEKQQANDVGQDDLHQNQWADPTVYVAYLKMIEGLKPL